MVEFSAVMVSASNRNVVYRSVFTWQAVSYVGYLSPQAMNSVSQVTQLGTATVLWYTTSITVKWEILRGSEHRIIHGSSLHYEKVWAGLVLIVYCTLTQTSTACCKLYLLCMESVLFKTQCVSEDLFTSNNGM